MAIFLKKMKTFGNFFEKYVRTGSTSGPCCSNYKWTLMLTQGQIIKAVSPILPSTRLAYDQKRLLQHIVDVTSKFDAELRLLRHDKFRMDIVMKDADLR